MRRWILFDPGYIVHEFQSQFISHSHRESVRRQHQASIQILVSHVIDDVPGGLYNSQERFESLNDVVQVFFQRPFVAATRRRIGALLKIRRRSQDQVDGIVGETGDDFVIVPFVDLAFQSRPVEEHGAGGVRFECLQRFCHIHSSPH